MMVMMEDADDDGDDGDVGAAAHEFSLLAALVTSRGLAHQVGTLHFYQINPRLEIYICRSLNNEK